MELTEGHKNQIRAMREEGKKPKEVIEFMKKTYNLDVRNDTIWHICKSKTTLPIKRKYTKRKPSAATKTEAGEDTIDSVFTEINTLIKALKGLYLENLKAIRRELIQVKAEIRGNSVEEATEELEEV